MRRGARRGGGPPEIALPCDPYEEAVIARGDPSGGEWFSGWWATFRTAFEATFRTAFEATSRMGSDVAMLWRTL
ncbi:MAG: hypothetical protein ACYCSX_09170 [Acidimicrobiales bacterium]